jgi:hypothetical protein
MLCYGRDRAIHAFNLFTRLQIRVSKSDQNMNVDIGLLLTASKMCAARKEVMICLMLGNQTSV